MNWDIPVPIIIQLAVLFIGGFNAWLTVRTRLEVTELKVYVHENFVHKNDYHEEN